MAMSMQPNLHFAVTEGVPCDTTRLYFSHQELIEKKRVLEKFSIECQYWKEKGIDWKIVTEKDIQWDKARNLQRQRLPP